MSGNVHVRLREKVDGNGLVVPHSRLQWGLLFFFWGKSHPSLERFSFLLRTQAKAKVMNKGRAQRKLAE
ncbi:hypothetical protein M5K25_028214 [Dendrobium thyrsiflorum]|uniref:Uncharacterized protein n=1 Tax=Dendrobium thyrsiflorum TaxID=117978 RepID=A0ABD0TU07_DENTH